MRIISWNVNGLRAVWKKGFYDWVKAESPDILGLQEIKMSPEHVPTELQTQKQWHTYYACSEKKGYSGTALFCKTPPLHYQAGLGIAAFDLEARVQRVDYDDFVLLNIYFPNGKGPARDNSRVPFKMEFYQAVFSLIKQLQSQGKEVIIMGDYNTAHREIDLKNWKGNQKISGFLPEEREEFEHWLQYGMVDTFRHVHGDKPDVYTWWSPLSGARARNVGWRIDYVLMTKGLVSRLKDAFVLPDVMGSDHCPVGIEIL